MSPEEEDMPPPRIDVIDLSTRKVIGRVKLNNTSPGHVERVMLGMMRNLRDGLVLKEVLK